MKTITATQAQANIDKINAAYDADDFSFADFISTSDDAVIQQALNNLEACELAADGLKNYWANSVSGSVGAYVAANGYGETIYAG